MEWDLERKDTTMTNRGIYYCGERCIGMYSSIPDKYGINMKDDRDILAQWLMNNYKYSYIYGPGWNKQTKYNNDKTQFRLKKRNDIEECNADFNLVIENFLMPGLVSERIHDGFNADRVMLYLGDPNIYNWVPKNCFVDLRPYFDTKTHKWDYKGIIELITNMTQEEYNLILNNARAFRKTMDNYKNIEGHQRIATELSKRLLKDKFVEKKIELTLDTPDSFFVSNHFNGRSIPELLETIRPNFNKLNLDEDAKRHLDIIGIPKEANKILEIGCGVGRLVKKLKNNGKDVIGVDASEDMVKNSNILQDGLDIRLCVGDGNLGFSNNTFDFVFSIITFQHIPNINAIKKYIGESYRVLNKGYFKFQILNDQNKDSGYLLKNFHSKETLMNTMKEVGFRDVCEKKIGETWILISGRKE
jgi:ubiquinone/menaquinone biosynthesis C-methylase UbiE